MDNSLTPEKQHLAIEDALHTYPVMPIPRDLSVDVLSRIQTVRVQRPRMTWTDLILGTVLAICIGAVWFSLQNLPPLVVAQIRKESILLYQQVLEGLGESIDNPVRVSRLHLRERNGLTLVPALQPPQKEQGRPAGRV